ncbi:MAG: DNA translocase FtsK 4TM domain-containing protein, partial [Bacteroidaceae bacterium]|nr:DNA translocase FtsK 4TM domain-containing protein [Bacteroidaceae bacterium]
MEHKDDFGDEMDMTRKENIRFIVGIVLCLVSSFIILSLVSHLFTGAEDQKIISNPDAIATNWMGNWGAEISQYMIMEMFGLPSIFIPIMLLVTSIRIMRIYEIRLHKWFLNCMVLMIWFSAALSYISMTLPGLEANHISLGGAIGLSQIQLVRAKIGTPGLFMVLLITAVCYLAYLSDEAISYLRSMLVIKKKPSEAEELDTESEENNETVIEEEQPLIVQNDDETEETEEMTVPHNDLPEDTATTIEFTDVEYKEVKKDDTPKNNELEIIIEDATTNKEETEETSAKEEE